MDEPVSIIGGNGARRHGVVVRIAGQPGIGIESLRRWVIQAEIDRGTKGGRATEDASTCSGGNLTSWLRAVATLTDVVEILAVLAGVRGK